MLQGLSVGPGMRKRDADFKWSFHMAFADVSLKIRSFWYPAPVKGVYHPHVPGGGTGIVRLECLISE